MDILRTLLPFARRRFALNFPNNKYKLNDMRSGGGGNHWDMKTFTNTIYEKKNKREEKNGINREVAERRHRVFAAADCVTKSKRCINGGVFSLAGETRHYPRHSRAPSPRFCLSQFSMGFSLFFNKCLWQSICWLAICCRCRYRCVKIPRYRAEGE